MRKVLVSFTIVTIFWGCGSTSDNGVSIDISNYYPNKNMIKSFYKITDSDDNDLYDEHISIDKNTITVKVDDVIKRTITINSSDIREIDSDDNLTKVIKKVVKLGAIAYTLPKSRVVKDIKVENTILGHESIESIKTCRLEGHIDKLNNYDIKYSGDILKFKCIEDKTIVTKVKENLPDYINLTNGQKKSDYDISYFYMKKNIGLIAKINDDCIVDNKGTKRINDLSAQCKEKKYTHIFFLM
jgi:hypothetical protein